MSGEFHHALAGPRPVNHVVQVYPAVDHQGFATGQPGGDFGPLLLGQDEIGFGKRPKCHSLD